ncbi:serine hydrolase domain-containing protein [Microbacterium sp. ZW T5_56]|uniref:serine hydrolase domain-containing protein n=1 Tax=Microbacterium sp. ZW T5_56 TaxID=3378081 RepID=UPI003853DB5F
MPAITHLDSALDDFLTGLTDDALELHSMLIVRGDAVIAELEATPRSLGDRRLVYSVSKTVTMIALATAIDDGLIGLDDIAIAVTALGITNADPDAARLTVRHLARMSSGHSSDSLDPMLELAAREGISLVDAWFRLPLDTEPGSTFSYDSGATYVLGALVRHVTGESLADRVRTRVFAPLGIGEFAWFRAAGDDEGFSGLHLTISDMARIGMLLRDRGVAAGRRIVSAELVDELTRSQIDNYEADSPDWSAGYGLQLWRSRHGFRADGAYGQFVLVLPEQDVVIAITSEQTEGTTKALLERVWQHLFPVIELPVERTVTRTIELSAPRGGAEVTSDINAVGANETDAFGASETDAFGGSETNAIGGSTTDAASRTYTPASPTGVSALWTGFSAAHLPLTGLRVDADHDAFRFDLTFADNETATIHAARGGWIAGAIGGLGGGNLPVDPTDRRAPSPWSLGQRVPQRSSSAM